LDGKDVIINLCEYEYRSKEEFKDPYNYRNGKEIQGIMLIYAIDSKHSFEIVGKTIEAIRSGNSNIRDSIPIILIGNKCDLEHERQVSFEEGKRFADKHGLVLFEASAQENINIEASILWVCNEVQKAPKKTNCMIS
jgi:GTPase SAR1 family protein